MIYHKPKDPWRIRLAAWLAAPTHHVIKNRKEKKQEDPPLFNEGAKEEVCQKQ